VNAVRLIPFFLRHLLPVTPQFRELRAHREETYRFMAELRDTLARDAVDDLAIPSYTHGNPLMRHLFWARLAVALEWLDGLDPRPSAVMDFGCGAGVLFGALGRRGMHVVACDIRPEVAAAGARSSGVTDIDIVDAAGGLAEVAAQSLEVILALDVLEHVEDVRQLAGEFARILTPEGRLLCSLPTENALYRLGRRLAGFSGHYHVKRPADVVAELSTRFRVRRMGRLYSFLPLFDFFEAQT